MKYVIIDSGHNERTAGKRSPDGTLREYKFNLDVSKRISEILRKHGIKTKVLYTEFADTDADVNGRVNIANKEKPDIFVSIHANAYHKESANGWEIFCYGTNKESEGYKLAKAIHDESIPFLGLKDRGIKDGSKYGVVRLTKMPAVLIEHGFYTNKEELELFIRQAMATNAYLTPDSARALPPKELCWHGEDDDLDQYDPYILEMDPQRKKEIAFEVMEEIYGKNKKIVSVNTEYGDMLEYQYMIDSQGFEGDMLQSNFTVSAECSVKGRGKARSEGWWYESALHYKDFTYKGCGEKALERALAKLNPKELEGGKMNMIVDNTSASRLVSPIFQALNGSNIQQRNSFLLNKKGEKVFSEKMTLLDNPHWKGMSGSRYFDGDGLATKPMDIIRNGVVETYYINTYSANKMECDPTVESASVPYFSLLFLVQL